MEPFKEQILNFRTFEFATTMKVLRAYPEDKLEMRPAEKSRTARELAVAFIREESFAKELCAGISAWLINLSLYPIVWTRCLRCSIIFTMKFRG